MFWIGIIVGIIIGVVGMMAFMVLFAMKTANMSLDEIGECGRLIAEAGNNRESTMSVWYDGMLLDTVDFEEK